jgi:hypothetical protein
MTEKSRKFTVHETIVLCILPSLYRLPINNNDFFLPNSKLMKRIRKVFFLDENEEYIEMQLNYFIILSCFSIFFLGGGGQLPMGNGVLSH